MSQPRLVTLGGGTGTFVTLSGLKAYNLNLTAIVTVADSGGSTGRLRDEFGFLPVGDLRQAIAALAPEDKPGQSWIKNLMLYRFAKGSGLEGHNLGNLILTSLQDQTNSTAKAVEIASHIFNLKGHIYPITTSSIQLVIEYQDGTVVIGEHYLDNPDYGGKKIINLKTSPKASIYSKAEDSLAQADLIIIGPGDLYGSILPNLVIQGTSLAIKKSPAKLVYIVNLMTRYTQTHGMSAAEHAQILAEYLGRPPDYLIINNQPIPSKILKLYQREHEYPVADDLSDAAHIIRTPLLKTTMVSRHQSDTTPRSFIRHDPQKLAKQIIKLI